MYSWHSELQLIVILLETALIAILSRSLYAMKIAKQMQM